MKLREHKKHNFTIFYDGLISESEKSESEKKIDENK